MKFKSYQASLPEKSHIVTTLIPSIWNQQILTKTGKADNNTISILSEITYWYRRKILKNANIKINLYGKNNNDAWQTSYRYLQTKLNISSETIRRCFVKLEKLNVISRELRTVKNNGQLYYNCLFIKLTLDHPLLQIFEFNNNSGNIVSKYKEGTPPQFVGDIFKNKEIKDIDNLDSLNRKKLTNKKVSELSEFFDKKIDNVKCISQHSACNKSLRNKLLKLNEVSLLTDQEAEHLRRKSGRNFSLNFMNQLLLKLKQIRSSCTFEHRNKFINYFAIILKYEKREEAKVNNFTYQMKFNIQSDNSEAVHYTKKLFENERIESYLKVVENSKVNNQFDQLKRKIAGGMEARDAYNLLTSLRQVYASRDISVINLKLSKKLELPINSELILLSLVKSVYGQNITNFNLENLMTDEQHQQEQLPVATTEPNQYIPQINKNSLWGRIRESLIQKYSVHMDQHWFSKIQSSENNESKRISLKAPSNFTRDWMNQNYHSAIERICNDLGWSLESKIIA